MRVYVRLSAFGQTFGSLAATQKEPSLHKVH